MEVALTLSKRNAKGRSSRIGCEKVNLANSKCSYKKIEKYWARDDCCGGARRESY